MSIRKETLNEIQTQVQNEINLCMKVKKQLVYDRWQRNEKIYYLATNWETTAPYPMWNNVTSQIEWQAPRVDLGEGIGFVQTMLSKIDNDTSFTYEPIEIADIQKAEDMNAIKAQDENVGSWSIKKRMARKTSLIYGRMIYEYFATGNTPKGGEYKSNLNVVHPYNFFIDPNCGGLTVQDAMFCGHYVGQVPNSDLAKGAREGIYNREAVKNIIGYDGTSSVNGIGEVEQLKQVKYNLNNIDTTDIVAGKSTTTCQMWKWYTTYKGDRYYVYVDSNSGNMARVEKLNDLYPTSAKIDERGLYPYASAATDPDVDIFFSLSPLDQVASALITKNVTVEAMIENFYKINRPQLFISIEQQSGLTPSDLKYYPDKISIIENGGLNQPPRSIDDIIQKSNKYELSTAAILYDKLSMISDGASGYTPGARGVSDDDKVGVYEGNQANVGDRFSLLEKNLSHAEKELAVLHYAGVIDHMSPKYAISYVGSNGLSVRKLVKNAKTLLPKGGRYDWKVSSSSSEANTDKRLRADKLSFIRENLGNFKNPELAIEIGAKAVGLTADEIRSLNSIGKEATMKIIGEVFSDLEQVISGTMTMPPVGVDEAYLKSMRLYIKEYGIDLTPKQIELVKEYGLKVSALVAQDTFREVLEQAELPEQQEQPEQQGQELPEEQVMPSMAQ